jgi:phosphate transport system substrate-binding protein
MSRVAILRLLVILLVGAGLGVLVYYSPAFLIKNDPPAGPPQLKTGGTSVAYIIMENRWRTKYRDEKQVEVVYDSSGSTKGITGMIEKKYAIGFTHAPLTEKQRKDAREKGGEVVHIPVVICAVVPVYNLKELKDKKAKPLKFTREVLGDIFLGKIKRWNDEALQDLNKGVALPDKDIKVVHRKDSSGTTYIFTDYLAGVSDEWKEKIGEATNKVKKWPVGEGEDRNQGVARRVRKEDGTIGYVDLLHIVSGEEGDLAHGEVQNQEKAFVLAKPESMTAAAKGLADKVSEDLTFKLTNQPGKGAYPICGAVWAVCYQKHPAAERQQVVDFLRWITHEGQALAGRTMYAPLPEVLVKRVEEKLESIKSIE